MLKEEEDEKNNSYDTFFLSSSDVHISRLFPSGTGGGCFTHTGICERSDKSDMSVPVLRSADTEKMRTRRKTRTRKNTCKKRIVRVWGGKKHICIY